MKCFKGIRFGITIVALLALLSWPGTNLWGQPGSLVTTLEVCANGIMTGTAIMDEAGINTGHRDKGEWIETAGLTFSDFGSNPVISGFELGQTYHVQWKRNNGNTYTFVLNASSQATSFTLLNANGTTNDVFSTGETNHLFSVDPSTGETYDFYSREIPEGDAVVGQEGMSNFFDYPIPEEGVFEVYSMVTESNGCISLTNSIEISNEDIQIRVEGGKSVCDGDFPFELYVRPYDPQPGQNYVWVDENYDEIDPAYHTADYPESILVTTSGTYRAVVYNNNYNNPAQRLAESEVYVGDYTLPAVTIDPPGTVVMCDETMQLAGHIAGPHPEGEDVSYRWSHFGSTVARGEFVGYTDFYDATAPGNYQFRVFETDNHLCYADSDPTSLVLPDIFLEVVNDGACTPVIPELMIQVFGDAFAQWEVVVSDGATTRTFNPEDISGNGVASGTFSWGSEVTSNTTFTIISVSSGGVCVIEEEAFPDPLVMEVFQSPDLFEISGGGCAGETVQISISGSEGSDVLYELLRGGDVVASLNGANGPLTYTVSNAVAGTYTVRATRGGCVDWMDGSVVVASSPNDLPVSISGIGCSGNPHVISIENSESDVFYSLFRDGIEVRVPRLGNGGDLSFSSVNLAGSYQVFAQRGACSLFLSGIIVIDKTPDAQTITVTEGCEGTDMNIALNGSESGVEYFLFDGADGGGSEIDVITGDGNAISFGVPVSVAGTYSVVAINPVASVCTRLIGNVTIHATPNLAYVLDTASDPACAGNNIAITLSGSETGIRYRLYRDDIITGTNVTGEWGNGGPISFEAQSEAGTYYVTAVNNGCEFEIPNTEVVINQQPEIFNVTNDNYCVGEDVSITLSNSDLGVSYRLFEGGAPYAGTVASGTGGAISFTAQYPVGTYTVMADAGGCTRLMNGSVSVNALPNVTINNLASDYCANAGVVPISGSPSAGTNSWRVHNYLPPLPAWFTDNGNHTATFDVDAALAASMDGTYTIYYWYEDPNTGCSNEA